MKRKATPERVEVTPVGLDLTPVQNLKKRQKAKLNKTYIAFEEPLLFHADKQPRPE